MTIRGKEGEGEEERRRGGGVSMGGFFLLCRQSPSNPTRWENPGLYSMLAEALEFLGLGFS